MSNVFSVRQRQSLCGRLDQKIDEEFTHCSSTLNDLPSSDQRVGRETESNVGEHAEGTLLKIHDRLVQIPASSRRGVQQYATLNNGYQSFHDVNRQGKSNAPDIFYPEYEGKRMSPQTYVKEAIRRQQELNELCRRNTAQAQMRQRKNYDETILQAKLYEVGQYVWVFQNVIPPKGTKKLLKKWRGPIMITEVHQQGRFYRLSTGRAA